MCNLWLLVKEDLTSDINEALSTPSDEYEGSVSVDTINIFSLMPVLSLQKVFKAPTIDGSVYYLYSLYIEDDDIDTVLSYLDTTYPNKTLVGGVWSSEGSRVEGYPLHSDLLRFMPDRWDKNLEQFVTATVLIDVNVLIGIQQPRDFS